MGTLRKLTGTSGSTARSRIRRWIVVTLVGALMAPAIVATATEPEPPPEPDQICVHPHPCEDDWPDGLEGPFPLREVEHVFVEMSDGVRIEGWVAHPDLPDGVDAPTLMVSSPYLYGCGLVGQLSGPYCHSGPGDEGFWDDPPLAGPPGALGIDDVTWHVGVPPVRFVQRGFAVAYFAFRGTANSGGCFGYGAIRDQQDQRELVEWVAARPWSNGRVGMAGHSWLSNSATQAAVQAPEPLKAVAISGVYADDYTFLATPQGAWNNLYSTAVTPFDVEFSLYPDPFHPERIPGRVPVEPDRVCPELVEAHALMATAQPRPDRNRDFWDERRLLDRFGDVTAAVLVMHGFDDDTGHRWQEEEMWESLTQAPKQMVFGPWPHRWPTESVTHSSGAAPIEPPPRWGRSFEQVMYDWFDYWLKGAADVPPELGTVDHQDRTGTWHTTTAWPPADATDEALYLAEDSLAAAGEAGTRQFATLGQPADLARPGWSTGEFPEFEVHAALCHDHVTDPLDSDGLAYLTPPQTHAALIAGNPHAWLTIESDQPAGVVDVRLVDVGPDFSCNAFGEASGFRLLGVGGADLRFHAGNFVARDFPVGVPTPIRVDLPGLSHRLDVGHQLALVMSAGEGAVVHNTVSPHQPTITVHAGPRIDASHVVIPVVDGTLGGAPDPGVATPRPFGPHWSPPA